MAQDYTFGHMTDHAEPSFGSTQRPAGRWDLPREGDVLALRYRVEQVRGQTGHELVLFASHIDLGQRVLVRMLSPEASDLPDVVSRFQRSARKALENRSEHAERVIDFGRLESGCPYRVSELPHGPSLAEILEVRGALPIQEVANVMISACEAVAEVHANNLLHRGLCPASMFIERRADGTPLVRVVDFGSAGGSPHEALLGHELSIVGADLMSSALPYTAPEQLRHPATVDARADLWALGAICYELLVGRAPFRAENPVTLLSMIAADPPTPPGSLRHDVPESLEHLVLDCLAKDPGQRPSSALELVNTLLPFASPELDELGQRVQRILRRSSHPVVPGAQSGSLRPSHSLGPVSSRAPRSYRTEATFDLGVEGVGRRSSLSSSSVRPSLLNREVTARGSVAPDASNPWPIAIVAVALSLVGAVVTTVLLKDEVPGFSATAEYAPKAAALANAAPENVERDTNQGSVGNAPSDAPGLKPATTVGRAPSPKAASEGSVAGTVKASQSSEGDSRRTSAKATAPTETVTASAVLQPKATDAKRDSSLSNSALGNSALSSPVLNNSASASKRTSEPVPSKLASSESLAVVAAAQPAAKPEADLFNGVE